MFSGFGEHLLNELSDAADTLFSRKPPRIDSGRGALARLCVAKKTCGIATAKML